MKLRIVSDLHFEFQRDQGLACAEKVTAGDYDALVIAGDLCDFKLLKQSLLLMCRLAGKRPVLFVLGNHECYGARIAEAKTLASEVASKTFGLHFLNRSSANVNGVTISGCSLWFPHGGKPEPGDHCLNDFAQISDAYPGISEEAARDERWLRGLHQAPSRVVVTHHLPHFGSVAKRFAGSPLNRYFLNPNVASVATAGNVQLWVHGHTHASCDYAVASGKTRVVCNPLGYAEHAGPGEPNPEFNPVLDVEVFPGS